MDLPATLPAELLPYTFLVGRWERGRDVEDWIAAGDVLVGVHLARHGAWTVHVLQATDEGGVRWLTFGPDGQDREAEPPEYRHEEGRGLLSTATGKPRRWHAVERGPAPALEQADLAFRDAVAADGAEAWAAAFDPDRGFQLEGDRRVAAGPDMVAYMTPTLSAGRLDWAPTASDRAGDVGFTVGDYTFTADGPPARGAYVTVWRQQPEGDWKVWFDTGDPLDAE